jgi:predicted HTH transcriptional regulator
MWTACQNPLNWHTHSNNRLTHKSANQFGIDEDIEPYALEIRLEKDRYSGLKPRHMKILDHICTEDTASSTQIARKTGRREKAVSSDLNYLFKKEYVERVRICGEYNYFIISRGDKIKIPVPETSWKEKNLPWT